MRGRQTGRTQVFIDRVASTAQLGQTVSIMELVKDEKYLNQIVSGLELKGILVQTMEVFKKVPANNMRTTFDRFGEPIGSEIVEQTQEHAGWRLIIVAICRTK